MRRPDHRVLEAAQRYEEKQLQRHGRLIRALRSYGDDSTSVGEALRPAAADLGCSRYDWVAYPNGMAR